MVNLFFDIETLPSAEEHKSIHLEILRKKSKKGTEKTTKTDIEIHESTSFEGTFGRICCIGYIKEVDGKETQGDCLSGDEKEILKKFWEVSRDVDRFVGHNIWDFDLPFIYQRSRIMGVKPKHLNFARYRNLPIYDTMHEWSLWNFDKDKKMSLDTLAKVLGLPTSKDEMDGSMVWKYFQEGRLEEICKYCMKDVELARQVYKKMAFEEEGTDPF